MAHKRAGGGHKPPSSTGKVGYGRPPKDTQFKPGQSGNPMGRPKGRRNIKTELLEELDEIVEVTERGVKKQVTTQRALIKGAVVRAANGNVRMLALIFGIASDSRASDQQTDTITDQSDQEILDRYNARILAQNNRDGDKND